MSYDPNQPGQDPGQQPPYGQPQQPFGQPPSQYSQQGDQQPQTPYGQPPYGQPQQPPYQQQWGQQPPQDYQPTQYVAPAYGAQPVPGYMPPSQQPKSRRGLWIALAIIAAVVLLGCAICGISSVLGIGFFAKTVAGPAITVSQYYNAVKQQDYATAYSYTSLTVFNGQPVTQDIYTRAAQLLDTTRGVVTNFSIGNITTNNSTDTVTVSVTRANTPAYDVQLQLQQINGSWKITSINNI